MRQIERLFATVLLVASSAVSCAGVLSIQPVRGPAVVPVASGRARLVIPPETVFLAREDAIRVLKRAGNSTDGSEVGLVQPSGRHAYVVIGYTNGGHVPDAGALEPEPLLAALRQAQEIQNEARCTRTRITIDGWAAPPAYDPAARRAGWAVSARCGSDALVHARTCLLGRTGYLSFRLVSTPADFPRDRALVDDVLTGCAFAPGERYGDFLPDRDPVASGGLAELVTGVEPHFRDPFAPALAGLAALCTLLVVGGPSRRRPRQAAARAPAPAR